jgi:hypothetical protein
LMDVEDKILSALHVLDISMLVVMTPKVWMFNYNCADTNGTKMKISNPLRHSGYTKYYLSDTKNSACCPQNLVMCLVTVSK